MKNKASGVIIIILFSFFSAFAQDTTVVKIDTITTKFHCLCNDIYKSNNDLDSCRHFINRSHEDSYKRNALIGRKESSPCKDYYSSAIDFSKSNLIISTDFVGGCSSPKKNYILYKILSQKKYLFVITISEIGTCKPIIPVYTHILTPKFEEDYRFEQNVIIHKK